MAVGFPTKDTFVNGDVYSAGDVNDLAGTVNTIPALIEANAGGQYAAGKNKIINGDFRINQRAFTSTTTTATYGFDRWVAAFTDGTSTYSAQTFTLGAAPVAGYEGTNFARLVSTGQTINTSLTSISQKIESVRTFAGQTVTLSFWAKASTGTPNVAASIWQEFGTGGSATVQMGSKVAITSSWARYSVTIAVPSISGKTISATGNDNLRAFLITSAGSTRDAYTGTLGIQSVTVDFWGVQVEAGSTASAFQTATGTIQGELAACQRYYYRTPTGIALNDVSVGGVSSSATLDAMVLAPVQLRGSPTALEQSGTAADYSVKEVNTIYTCSAVPTFVGAGLNTMTVRFTVASSLTNGRAGFGKIGVSGFLGWSAEL
jgi:hypothetical protein